MQQVNMSGYVRINKTVARRLYNAGKKIRIVPCKYVPDNYWVSFDLDNYSRPDAEIVSFDSRINLFEHFNCVWETGYYAAYYIKE